MCIYTVNIFLAQKWEMSSASALKSAALLPVLFLFKKADSRGRYISQIASQLCDHSYPVLQRLLKRNIGHICISRPYFNYNFTYLNVSASFTVHFSLALLLLLWPLHMTGKYESHTRVHTREKPFQCDVCLQRYSTKSNLTVHKKKHTADAPVQRKDHKCPFCNKLHASRKTLSKHVKRWAGDVY